MKAFLYILIFSHCAAGFCQEKVFDIKPALDFLFSNCDVIQNDSGIIVNSYIKKSCKSVLVLRAFIPFQLDAAAVTYTEVPLSPEVKFITVHGNISYDFLYRSKLDTSLAQGHFKQHTERVSLNILLTDKYPLKVAFVLRQSNSPWFRNFANINFQFDQQAYLKTLKQQIAGKLVKSLASLPDIKALEALLAEKEKQYLALKSLLESPATLQKIIEERERINAQQEGTNAADKYIMISVVPGANNPENREPIENKYVGSKEKADSISVQFARWREGKSAALDTLSKQVKALHQQADSIKGIIQKNITKARQKIYSGKSVQDLMRIAAANGIDSGLQNNFQRKLAAVKNFNIGRSIVNYTELTAQNLTVTGINIEYNPSYYAAVVAGKIDYGFRNYFNRNTSSNGQYLILARVGFGNLEKRALLFTLFKGRKNSTGNSVRDSAASQVNIIGYSVEAVFKKDENTFVSFEAAKSTKPVTGNLQSNKQINALWQFNEQANAGMNIKAQAIIPGTSTKLSGFYRKTGEYFQSFSLFSYNTDQVAWLARADQYFFKERLTITGMLRRNDFTNPFTDKTYKTSTVFKSVQLNIRVPKYPGLSLGYYPGSQLYYINEEKIREHVYYILNGSVVHSYVYNGRGMRTSFIYNHHFNKATDAGFAMYKGVSYYALQTIFFKKIQVQGGYTYNSQPGLMYTTLEASADYGLRQSLQLAGGIKYSKVRDGSIFFGQTIQFVAALKEWGRVQIQYEKSFLPTINQTLYPVETGRVSWHKYF